MFYLEIRRKYINVVFLLIVLVGCWWLYSAIKPSAYTNSYDVFKYTYYKPLSKVEFIYFNLTKDYEEGTTIAYSDTNDTDFWPEDSIKLKDTSKKHLLAVIKEINPDYKSTEKMNDITLQLDLLEAKPYLQNLEKQLKIKSFYYTGMFAPETYNEEFDMIDSASPYWTYLSCGQIVFRQEQYEQKARDFALTYQNGISNGYAKVALDYIGILIGILSLIYSFQTFAEDKRANINGFIYTEKINSVQHVLGKYFATVIPLMIVSFVYMLFVAGCFTYWNEAFDYGYDIQIFDFVKHVPTILFPTICIIVALSQLLGILIQKEMISAVIQFVFFYLSMSGVPKHCFSLNMIIRYSSFDDYTFYSAYLKYLPLNRALMCILSAVLLGLTILIFEYRKVHEKLLDFSWIRKKVFKSPIRKMLRRRDGGNSSVVNNLGVYILKQSVHIRLLLYIPYLALMFPIVVSKNIDASSIAIIGENIIIFASLFLFIRLGNMEKNSGMEAQVFTANRNYSFLYFMRVIVASIVLFVLVEVPIGILCIQNNVTIDRWCIGVYLSSLFIGLISLLITEVLESSFAGYFFYIMYYFFDGILKKGMIITLSGYTKRIEHSKIYLAEAIIVVVVALIICVSLKVEGIRISNKYGNKNK